MFQLEWPLVWLLAPLPALAWWLLPPPAHGRAALRVPAVADFALGGDGAPRPGQPRRWRQWLAIAGWLLLLLAASRPQWLGESTAIAVSGRDLVLAVDLSDSMRMPDFVIDGEAVDRLTATKRVASEFIERRRGDRLGLVLFGTRAYLQAPLTFDNRSIAQLLDEAAIGLAGERTAIGDAIGLALKRLEQSAGESRVLILMTDGENTAGEVTPLKAAEIAAQRGLRIYTIGIGAEEMLQNTLFGTRRIDPSAQLDERTLREIASLTGGEYYRARDSEELESIYRSIDAIEPLERDRQHLRPLRALFMWPLALALAIGAALALPRAWGRA